MRAAIIDAVEPQPYTVGRVCVFAPVLPFKYLTYCSYKTGVEVSYGKAHCGY